MASNYKFEDTQQFDSAGYDPNFVPDSVKSFVVHLYRRIREKNVYEIHQMYETSFQTLSECLFKNTPWPSVDVVAQYVDNDHVFCLLYREMWFRHLYARLSPILKQRIDSWDNYCSLFQLVLLGEIVVAQKVMYEKFGNALFSIVSKGFLAEHCPQDLAEQ